MPKLNIPRTEAHCQVCGDVRFTTITLIRSRNHPGHRAKRPVKLGGYSDITDPNRYVIEDGICPGGDEPPFEISCEALRREVLALGERLKTLPVPRRAELRRYIKSLQKRLDDWTPADIPEPLQSRPEYVPIKPRSTCPNCGKTVRRTQDGRPMKHYATGHHRRTSDFCPG